MYLSTLLETRRRHTKKISSLSNEQDKPLRGTQFTVRNLTDKSPPTYVTELLSFGPKHPIKDKFRELHFLADMDKLLVEIGDGDVDRQNEINALTIRYNNKMRKQRPERAVAKTNAYLKEEGLKAVPYDKGAGFCLLTEKQYQERLQDIQRGNSEVACQA